MKEWKIDYKDAKHNGGSAVVTAPTYTMAIVQFMREYPDYHYEEVKEVTKDECETT